MRVLSFFRCNKWGCDRGHFRVAGSVRCCVDSVPMRRIAWRIAYVLIGLVLSFAFHKIVHAGTSAPATVYTYAGLTGSSVGDLGAQYVASIGGVNTQTCGGVSMYTWYRLVNVTSTTFGVQQTDNVAPCHGVWYAYGGTITPSSSAGGCVPPQYLQSGVCTDAKLAGGACNKGSLEGLSVASAGFTGGFASYNGCQYVVVTARNNCTIGGVASVCGVFEGTGTTSPGGTPSGGSTSYQAPGDPATGPAFTCTGSQVPVTVNGVNICIPPVDTSPAITYTGGQTVAANGDTVATVEATKTTGTTSATTKSTTTTPSGGSPTTATSQATATPTVKAFCEDNPNSTVCVQSTLTGTCGSVSCTGDAVTCAIARDQMARHCALFDTATAQSTLADLARVGADPTVVAGTPFAVTSTSMSANPLDQTAFLGSSSCPADKSVAFGAPLSFSVVLPFSKLCDALALAGAIGVAFSLIAGAFIVFKGVF